MDRMWRSIVDAWHRRNDHIVSTEEAEPKPSHRSRAQGRLFQPPSAGQQAQLSTTASSSSAGKHAAARKLPVRTDTSALSLGKPAGAIQSADGRPRGRQAGRSPVHIQASSSQPSQALLHGKDPAAFREYPRSREADQNELQDLRAQVKILKSEDVRVQVMRSHGAQQVSNRADHQHIPIGFLGSLLSDTENSALRAQYVAIRRDLGYGYMPLELEAYPELAGQGDGSVEEAEREWRDEFEKALN